MKQNQRLFKTALIIGLFLIIAVILSAYSSTMNWKEEVQLHDGQIIVVERFYNLGNKPTWESRERAALDETVTISLPVTNKKIIWKNDFRDSQPEPSSLNLIRFDVVKGVPYIATYPAGCIAYNKWGRPNPPQVLFKYEDEKWKRITLAEFPAELINSHANVVVGRPKTSLLKSFYTVEGVNAENREIDEGPYKTILREPLPVERCPQYSSGPKAPIPITPK
ncbi:MAG: hypothetical protein ABI479_02815 [Gallionella sp.]